MLYNLLQSGSVSVSVHPLTQEVVLRNSKSPANLLVGYVAVSVKDRAISISSLDVKFVGEQTLTVRKGSGPGSSLYEINDTCAEIKQRVVDHTITTQTDIEIARVAQNKTVVCTVEACHPIANFTNKANADKPAGKKTTICVESIPRGPDVKLSDQNGGLVLPPGNYRFPFNLELPSDIPATVVLPLGSTLYKLKATLSHSKIRHATSKSLPIQIINCKVPRSSPIRARSDIEDCNIYVYSKSDVLYTGDIIKLWAFITPPANRCSCDNHVWEFVEFKAVFCEYISLKATKNSSAYSYMRSVAEGSLGNTGLQLTAYQDFDPEAIELAGNTEFKSLNALSIDIPLHPCDGKSGAQVDSTSTLFQVTHKLRINIEVKDCKKKIHKIAFDVPVFVFPKHACSQGAIKALPSYEEIANDTLLLSSANTSSTDLTSYN